MMERPELQSSTLEVQQLQIDAYNKHGGVRLGPWTSHLFYSDPKHLAFSLARYKFVSKMLAGAPSVLEVGCGDCFGSVIVADSVGEYIGIDFDEFIIEDNKSRLGAIENMRFFVQDILSGPFAPKATSAFSLDVIEHIPNELEAAYVRNVVASTSGGPVILGTPNITASAYASKYSKISHINLKSAETLKACLEPYFKTVLNFSMNDEVVHTGYSAMAHYIFVLGVDPR